MQRFQSLRYMQKTRTVCVRVSQAEEIMLKAEAKRIGKPVTSLIREGYLGKVARMLV